MKTKKNVRRKKIPTPKAAEYSAAEMEAIEKLISEYFGAVEYVYHEITSSGIHLDICVVPPGEGSDHYTLATMGMGVRRMNVPKELASYGLERAELAIALPPDWKLDKESLMDERWYWPIRLLLSAARIPIKHDTWLGSGHTIQENEGETYAEGTGLCGCILIDPPAAGGTRAIGCLPNGDPVNFYQVLPLYKEELDYDIEYGFDALMTKMGGVASLVVDPRRPSALD